MMAAQFLSSFAAAMNASAAEFIFPHVAMSSFSSFFWEIDSPVFCVIKMVVIDPLGSRTWV